MKYATIKNRAGALYHVQRHKGYNGLAHRVSNLIDGARCNADETVHIEKTLPESEFDNLAAASLESLLAYCNDEEVTAWFTKQGFTF